MSIDLSKNTGLVVLYVGQDHESATAVSDGLTDTVAKVLVRRTIVEAREVIVQRPDVGVMVLDSLGADDDFLNACGRFPYDMHRSNPSMSIIVIGVTGDNEEHQNVRTVCDRELFYSDHMAEIITQAGREWAQLRAERQLHEHSLEILYAIARKADPRESLRKLMELWLPYLDITFADKALLIQAACLCPILNLRTGDRDICAPAQDNIFHDITALADPTSETGQILEMLRYFERMLQQQITISLSYAINNTASKFGASNPLVKALQQLVRDKSEEVSAIYTRAN